MPLPLPLMGGAADGMGTAGPAGIAGNGTIATGTGAPLPLPLPLPLPPPPLPLPLATMAAKLAVALWIMALCCGERERKAYRATGAWLLAILEDLLILAGKSRSKPRQVG